LRELARSLDERIPIIGVGGIFSAADAREKLVAGASLVQLYSGLIYEGPGLVRRIAQDLAAHP
jgi:dihydroorotate dehydrogenase